MTRRNVTVEFARHGLPIMDKDIRRRMTLLLELARGDKILSLNITTRAYLTREQRFVFEGVAQISEGPAESDRLTEPVLFGQPGGPKTTRTGWWQKTVAK